MRLWEYSRATWILLLLLATALTQFSLLSAADEFDGLVAAILSANSGEGSGFLTLSGDVVLSAPLPPITGTITIDGNGHAISGDGKYRIFDVNGGRLSVNNVTMTEGKAPAGEDGGAVRMRYGAELTVQSALFTDNSANFGGAIMMLGSSTRLTVQRSSFSGNRAREYAGAIYAIGEATISGSSFVANISSDSGGALVASNVKLDISNSTFHDNRAQYNGGGIFVFSGEVTLTHVTMTGNRLISGYSSAGSALVKQAISGNEGPVRLRNSIVVGHGSHPACAGGLDQQVGNLSPDGACAVKPGANPKLDELAGRPAYRPLQDRSPAVDAADPAYCMETDQIGTPRPQGGGCDIGAMESTTARPPEAPVVPPPPCPLADQIVAANSDAPYGGCRAGSGHDTIVLNADIELSALLPAISSEITIEGNGHTIDGRRRRIFNIDHGKLIINDLTLSNGAGSGFGGAIRLQNGSQLIVNNSKFIHNRSSRGGAIGMMFDNWVTINNSTFLRNRAPDNGGAISMNGGGTLYIRNSSFVDNFARSAGGAIDAISGSVSASNSSFINNRAGKGSALYAGGGGNPGATRITLTHVTVLNTDGPTGSGIHVDRRSFYEIDLSLRNSVIARVGSNGATLCYARLAQNIHNLIEDGSCQPHMKGDAQFESVTDASTYVAPLAVSPVIDAAHPEYCSERDQMGQARPLGHGCDIGAIEAMPPILTLSDCRVTTTHGLNFRDGPLGNRIDGVPYNAILSAMARTPGWFQVEYRGRSGWISADYVVTEGECG